MTLLDHPLVCERYFFPRREPPPRPFWVEVEGARLACHREGDDPAARTLVHFHGNGEVVADYVPEFVALFRSLGWNVLLAEYRGYGGSSGEPALVRMLPDVAAVHAALGLAPERVVVYGRSVGSIYAIEYAARFPRVAGLILESGIADPLQRVLMRVHPEELGTTREALAAEAARHLDHRAKLGGYRGPLLVLHAREDRLVRSDHAERNHAWAGGADKRLVLLPHGDHNTVLAENLPQLRRVLAEFAARLEGAEAG